jgi:hypothetical protein
MKKIVSVLVIALVWGTMAGAADIAFYIGAPNVDGWYDVATQNQDVDKIIAETGNLFNDVQKFDDSQAQAMGAWVDKNTNDGEMDILWLNGCMPNILYPYPNVKADGSRIEAWLDGGNMIINVGDWFGYVSYEGGARQTENGPSGAANILDLTTGIIVSADNTSLTVTPKGKEYLPSLKDPAITYRPVAVPAVTAPWEVSAVFAQNAAGNYADPIVIHNKTTDAYVAFINQCAGGTAVWIDRGQACAEFIGNWVNDVIGLGPQPLARGPNPRNGSMIDQTRVQASWRAGDFATVHDVFFGESLEAVSAATSDDAAVYVGRQAVAQLPMGMPGGPAPEGLVPGQTYFWRVDEINPANPDSPWRGSVWSFTVRPLSAFKPFPPDGMRNIDPNQDLSWDIGQGVIFHTIYVGQSFDEVNNATTGGMMSAAAQYDPGPLALDKTYYWRVDEFAFPAATTSKGPVWSFTTRGAGGGAKAVYFNGMDLSGDPVLTRIEGTINVNTSAEVVAGLSDLVSARWTADLEAPFTEDYRIITSSDDGVRLWFDGRLVIDNWNDHGTTDNIYEVGLIAGQIYGIRMEWYENGGGAVAQLSWQSPTLARQIIPQGWLQLPLRATGPSPANAEPYAMQDAVLQWIAGEEATTHDVYFGTDANAVANADTSAAVYKGSQKVDETTFDPGNLEWGRTYFWRVDEVNPGNAESPWKGRLWSFTTADFLVVENFESYDDAEDTGTRIYETWLDGYSDGSSGSIVGYINPPFAEQIVVHGGYQSMPLDYNNVNAPFYSEATREWSTAQNWTVNGVDTLTLHFRGRIGNGAEKLYVTLTDSAGKTATVVHPDAAAAALTQWTAWKIPLSSFTGVNGAKIKTMVIGLGDRSNPKPGGAGLLFIDDIWMTKP